MTTLAWWEKSLPVGGQKFFVQHTNIVTGQWDGNFEMSSWILCPRHKEYRILTITSWHNSVSDSNSYLITTLAQCAKSLQMIGLKGFVQHTNIFTLSGADATQM